MAGHCPWVLVWAGACYWHGVGGFKFNSSPSPLVIVRAASDGASSCAAVKVRMGWRVFMRRAERERGGKIGTSEKSIAREAANGIAIRASKNDHRAHSAPVWRPRVVGIV